MQQRLRPGHLLATKFVFAARSGLGKYTPVDGKISVEYKNISSEPVTINIYRLQRTCDAEACQFLAAARKAGCWSTRWMNSKRSLPAQMNRTLSLPHNDAGAAVSRARGVVDR